MGALLRHFPTLDEVNDVLHGMPREKVAGLDGMTVEILDHHWDTIKGDLLDEMLHFFNHCRMLSLMNHKFLVLIPKINSPSTLNDYTPISCVGISYKVISKLLANRLLTVLPNLIVDNLVTFIKGRRISNCINLA